MNHSAGASCRFRSSLGSPPCRRPPRNQGYPDISRAYYAKDIPSWRVTPVIDTLKQVIAQDYHVIRRLQNRSGHWRVFRNRCRRCRTLVP
uniref:Uncharacterized protein n=1 Tax=Ralstonia solanacearum TaxID=305 RepID=A0A0S4WMH7_RALSL|nr:protein of unknown function [Ralstonia solanacearum]